MNTAFGTSNLVYFSDAMKASLILETWWCILTQLLVKIELEKDWCWNGIPHHQVAVMTEASFFLSFFLLGFLDSGCNLTDMVVGYNLSPNALYTKQSLFLFFIQKSSAPTPPSPHYSPPNP